MKFLGVLKKNAETPDVNKKRNEISRGDQKNIVWNFYGSWFLALEISMGVT